MLSARLTILALAFAACGPPHGAQAPGHAWGKGDTDQVFGAGSGLFHLQLRSEISWEEIPDHNERFGDSERVEALTVIDALATPTAEALEITLCAVSLPEDNGYEPYVDGETVASFPRLTASLSFGPRGLKSSLVEVSLGEHGVDSDGDGEPGITIGIRGHESWKVFAGVRITLALTSGYADGDGLAGDFDFSLEQTIYGDTILGWLFDAAASLRRFRDRHRIASSTARYRLTPLDGGSGCSALPSH